MYFCNVVSVYGLAYFVPSIIAVSLPLMNPVLSSMLTISQAMGHSGVMASLYSAPPYLVGLGFLIIGGTLGDHFKRRLPIILVQTSLGTIGLARKLETPLGTIMFFLRLSANSSCLFQS